jgi:ribose transport system substrate-binding protein
MNHRKRRLAASVVLTMLAIGPVACSHAANDPRGDAPSGSADDGVGCPAASGKTVGFSEPLSDPNFQAIEQILSKALDKYGAKLRVVNANLDPGKQISDITTLMQQQISVLIANPVDPNATQGVLAQVRQKNVPIVALDTKVGGPYFTTVHDAVEDGAAQGAQILKQLVGTGQVAAIYGPAYAEILNWEKASFEAAAKAAGLNVVETQVNQKINPTDAKAIAEAWKQKYGANLKGIWTFNDTSAIGVASTISGDFAPKIVSINGQPDASPLVSAGKINTTFGVPYDKTGQALAYAALRALCHGSLPSEIYIPTVKLDQSNIATWEPIAQRVNNPFSITLQNVGGKTYVKLS